MSDGLFYFLLLTAARVDEYGRFCPARARARSEDGCSDCADKVYEATRSVSSSPGVTTMNYDKPQPIPVRPRRKADPRVRRRSAIRQIEQCDPRVMMSAALPLDSRVHAGAREIVVAILD